MGKSLSCVPHYYQKIQSKRLGGGSGRSSGRADGTVRLRSLLFAWFDFFSLPFFRRQRFSQWTCAVPRLLKAISRTFLLQVGAPLLLIFNQTQKIHLESLSDYPTHRLPPHRRPRHRSSWRESSMKVFRDFLSECWRSQSSHTVAEPGII